MKFILMKEAADLCKLAFAVPPACALVGYVVHFAIGFVTGKW